MSKMVPIRSNMTLFNWYALYFYIVHTGSNDNTNYLDLDISYA